MFLAFGDVSLALAEAVRVLIIREHAWLLSGSFGRTAEVAPIKNL
jgi:hypothetical protein